MKDFAIKEDYGERDTVRCPACKCEVLSLTLIRGNVYTRDGLVIVKSFKCNHCQKVIHWGERK